MDHNCSKIINKALIDDSTDLEFIIKDNILIGKPWKDDLETDGIAKILFKQFNDFPNHVGQIDLQTNKKTTFAEIKDRSIRCALWLKKLGIGKGDVVSTSIPLQNDDYVPVLAAIFIGAIINPWNHKVDQSVREHCFKTTKPKIMFAWAEGIDVLVSAAKNAQVECTFVAVGKHPDYPSLSDLMAERDQKEVEEFRYFEPENPKQHVSALMFSSGTTHYSKAFTWSYDIFVKNRFYYRLTRTHSNYLSYSSFAWSSGIHCFITGIRTFLTRILHSEFDAEETSAVIEKFEVQQAFLPPIKVMKMCEAGTFKKYDFSKLETIVISGSKLGSSTFDAVRKVLPNTLVAHSLGISESGGTLTIQTKNCQSKNSLGRVVGSVQLKVIDLNSGDTLGANQEGEMCFKVDSLMIEYLNNPEQTKKAIDTDGWLHSGDLGYYDENGEVWITARIKQMITVRGRHMPSLAIEDVLLQHPAIADAVVIPVPHVADIERPFAFVVKKPGAKVTAEELMELPATYDEDYRICGGIVFINKIPYNSNGKKSLTEVFEMAKSYTDK